MTGVSILFIGFLLGIKHATDADHLAAVATLASGQTSLRQTLRQGVAWGIGHAATLMLVGGIVLALGKSLPEKLAHVLELAVGVMLIALGTDVLRRLRQRHIHFHVHDHAPGVRHLHAHAHAAGSAGGDPRAHHHNHAPPLRALAVGMMHGMAGSAALILLSLQAVQSASLGIIYIALFGLGSVAGMALLSVAIAIPLRWSAGYFRPLHSTAVALVGAFTCALGVLIVYRIGEELLIG